MGMAVYYGKIVFEEDEQAEKNLPKVERFLEQMAKTEDDWQDRRRSNNFPALWDRHKRVFRALEIPRDLEVDSSMNQLAGILDSPSHAEDFVIFTYGQEIRFAGEVWHFANWDPMIQALMKITGAVDGGYVSDEYADINYWNMI